MHNLKKKGTCAPKSQLKKSLFTPADVDNIDHNPSARTAKDSFHGTCTAVSLNQYRQLRYR